MTLAQTNNRDPRENAGARSHSGESEESEPRDDRPLIVNELMTKTTFLSESGKEVASGESLSRKGFPKRSKDTILA